MNGAAEEKWAEVPNIQDGSVRNQPTSGQCRPPMCRLRAPENKAKVAAISDKCVFNGPRDTRMDSLSGISVFVQAAETRSFT